MAETVGLLVLSLIPGLGLEIFASTLIIGTITVGQVVGYGALIAASIGLSYLTAKTASAIGGLGSNVPSPESGHVPLRQSIASRIRGYGRNRLAGTYMLFEEDSGTSYDVIAFHHGLISGIVGYYLQDDVVELDGSGIVQEQADGRYADSLITIKTRLGLDTETAYTDIVSAIPTVWTTAHRGDGIASASLVCEGTVIDDFTAIYPRGLPQLSVIADCAPLFDARNGGQSYDDETTWLVSANPVVQIIEFLTNADSGMGLDRDTLITPAQNDLNDEADLCDEAVALSSGSSEPRYESNGFFALDSDPVDVLAAMLDACDGWLSENGDGSLALKVGVYRAPEFTIETAHIKAFTLQYGTADEETVNQIDFSYTEPSADYKTLPGAPWRDETDIAARGKVRSQTFSLPWVQSHTQARRLAKRKMAKLNASLRGTIKTTLYGVQAMGERWITIEAPELSDDLSSRVVEVLNLKIDLIQQEVSFDFVSVNPNEIDAWDSDTEEGTAPVIPSKLVAPAPPVPANLDAMFAHTFVHGVGPSPTPIIYVEFDNPLRSDLRYQMRYRISGSGSAYATTSLQPSTYAYPPSSPRTAGKISVAFGGLTISITDVYEVSLRAYAPSGAPSAYSTSDDTSNTWATAP